MLEDHAPHRLGMSEAAEKGKNKWAKIWWGGEKLYSQGSVIEHSSHMGVFLTTEIPVPTVIS